MKSDWRFLRPFLRCTPKDIRALSWSSELSSKERVDKAVGLKNLERVCKLCAIWIKHTWNQVLLVHRKLINEQHCTAKSAWNIREWLRMKMREKKFEGDISLQGNILVEIYPCRDLSLWGYILVGIYPCGDISLWGYIQQTESIIIKRIFLPEKIS